MRKQKLKTCYKNVTNYHFNHFQANVPILYPLKTPENLWSDVKEI